MKQYTFYVVPGEFQVIKKLPANVRQRIKRAIDDLADNPRPSGSGRLDVSHLEIVESEVWRLRINNWRVVYLVTEKDKMVDVVAVRKRPPYDYGDLAELLKKPN
jgi:mRNA interferase RelE/StbE